MERVLRKATKMSDYCQFNLDFAGNYICGERHDEDDRYFVVRNPTFAIKSVQRLNPAGETIHLLKDAVVCYFPIKRN